MFSCMLINNKKLTKSQAFSELINKHKHDEPQVLSAVANGPSFHSFHNKHMIWIY